MKSLRLIPGITILLLIVVTCATAQTPLWTHPSPLQSTTDQVTDLARRTEPWSPSAGTPSAS